MTEPGKIIQNGLEKDEKFKEVCDLLNALQKFKGRRYGESWCKHGEAVSIFGNIARKYDRIEKIIVDKVQNNTPLPEPESEESLAETVGDLVAYGILWMSWISVNRPREYKVWKERIGMAVSLNE